MVPVGYASGKELAHHPSSWEQRNAADFQSRCRKLSVADANETYPC